MLGRIVAAGFLLHLFFMPCAAHSEALDVKEREVRYVMGTLLDITVYAKSNAEARRAVDESFLIAQELDGVLSNYSAESELSKLNSQTQPSPSPVSDLLYDFLLKAKHLNQITSGAFDITVGSVVDLWRRSFAERRAPPSAKEVAETVRLVGPEMFGVLDRPRAVQIKPGVVLDSGGLGKGYAVDRIVDHLREINISRALVNFGHSSAYGIGAPPGQDGWNLELNFAGMLEPVEIVLHERAFSGSDTLGSVWRDQAGNEYGHIIDPLTGMPPRERLQGWALSDSAALSEAMTKYLVLRGCPPQSFLAPNLSVHIVKAGKIKDCVVEI